MAQSVAINVKGLDADGVILIPSTSPGFTSEIAGVLGPNPSAEIATLAQYSVVIKNRTANAIKGYSLRWTCIDRSGRSIYNSIHEDSFSSIRRGTTIKPGQSRLITPFTAIDLPAIPTQAYSGIDLSKMTTQISGLSRMASITAAIDVVAFDNGKIVGPDEMNIVGLWRNKYAAQRAIALAALTKRAQNEPYESIRAWVEAQARADEVFPDNATEYERFAGDSHWLQFYSRMTANRLAPLARSSPTAFFEEVERLAKETVPMLYR